MKKFFELVKVFSLLEIRSKEVSIVMFSSVLLVAMLLAAGVGTAFLDPYATSKIFPFVFWTTIITSCSVALGRSFETELRCGVMEAFVSSRINLRQVYFAKLFVVSVLLFIAMFIGLLLLGVMFQVPLRDSAAQLTFICIVLSVAYAALGNLLSVVASGSNLKSALLPSLLIPTSFPLFFASLELTYGILQKDPDVFQSVWFSFSVFMALLYSLLGALLFPPAVKGQF